MVLPDASAFDPGFKVFNRPFGQFSVPAAWDNRTSYRSGYPVARDHRLIHHEAKSGTVRHPHEAVRCIHLIAKRARLEIAIEALDECRLGQARANVDRGD